MFKQVDEQVSAPINFILKVRIFYRPVFQRLRASSASHRANQPIKHPIKSIKASAAVIACTAPLTSDSCLRARLSYFFPTSLSSGCAGRGALHTRSRAVFKRGEGGKKTGKEEDARVSGFSGPPLSPPRDAARVRHRASAEMGLLCRREVAALVGMDRGGGEWTDSGWLSLFGLSFMRSE